MDNYFIFKHSKISILILLAIVVLGLNIAGRDLWAPDEPRYAGIATEMWNKGEYFLPILNGEAYYNKPPGYFWLILAASMPAGEVNGITARLPSIFLGVAILIMLFLWLKRYSTDSSPLTAPLILLTTYLFWWFSGRVNIDISFSFFVSAACLAFHHGYHIHEGRFSKYYILAYLSIGMGLIVKGPFALLPLLIIVIYLLRLKDLKALKNLRFYYGVILIAVPVLVWLIPALIQGGSEYFNHAILEQIGGRIVKSYSHPHPFYFYLYILPANFMPWAFLFIASLIGIYRKNITIDDTTRFAIIWMSVIFIVISLVSAKQPHYLLPLFPAVAIITSRLFLAPRWSGARVALIITLVIFALISLALPVFAFLKLPDFRLPSIILALALATVTVRGFRATLSDHKTDLFSSVFLFMLILTFFANIWLLPVVNTIKSPRFILSPYVALDEDAPFAVYNLHAFNYSFFIDHKVIELGSEEEIAEFLDSHENLFLLVKQKHYLKFDDELKNRFSILKERMVGSKVLVLLRSKVKNK